MEISKQLNFMCPLSLEEHLQVEKLRTSQTISDIIVEALTRYFDLPADQRIGKTHASLPSPHIMNVRTLPSGERELYVSYRKFIDLAETYFAEMPEPKKKLTWDCMMLDVLHYRSSRVKAKGRTAASRPPVKKQTKKQAKMK